MNARRLLERAVGRSRFLRLKSRYWQRASTLSQFGQDFWVFGEVFNEKRDGFFVEIGAADGITFSNTFLLEKRYGWKGICIEADPASFADLRIVRNVACVNVCLDAVERDVEFVRRDVLGGIVGDDTDNRRDAAETTAGTVLTLRTDTLAAVLKRERAPSVIDYLSIDVEGAEDRVLGGFPFDDYRFTCITIERPKAALRDTLGRHGYVLVKEVPHLDVFYVHESFYDSYQRNCYRFWARHRNGRARRRSIV